MSEIKTSGKYFTHLNLLRGIAALMVSFYHFSWFGAEKGQLFSDDHWFHQPGKYGCTGVYIFFVISGFVIPWSMYSAGYKMRMAGKFMLKRIIRLEPPYLASIAVLIAWYSYLSHTWGTTYPIEWKRIALHIGYFIPFARFVPFIHTHYDWYNIVYWTLSIEFCYYLLMMLVFPLLNSENRYLRYSVLLLFLCGPFISDDVSFLPLFMPCFLLGFLIFLNFTGRMGAIEMLIWAVGSATMNYFYRHQFPEVIVFTLIAFFFIWKVKSNTWIGNRLGDISYSYYLIHGLVGNTWLHDHYNPNAGTIAKIGMVFTAIGICIISATIFYWLFERYPKKWSHRIKLN